MGVRVGVVFFFFCRYFLDYGDKPQGRNALNGELVLMMINDNSHNHNHHDIW